ncbi:hypothetical protein EVAR_91908_1 [Eumeta japonica]|uniref:Uncharacterized protein n=1 Tax=Eumeta variegata TaxID=151549 RepID=A0A4C1SZG8_EUMVA|nr:hypothetical protein EVAR_91908_1 [Eumeta japonica]
MCIRTVMTYASPVFAHAAPKALHRLQSGSPKLSSTRPPLTASAGGEGNRPGDGFLRSYAETTSTGVVHSAASRAVGTACAVRPWFGEVYQSFVDLSSDGLDCSNSIADLLIFTSGEFFSGFLSYTTRVSAG